MSIRGASIADLPHALADRRSSTCGTGIGIFVGHADDPEVGGRTTAAPFVLDSTEEVQRFLDTLAR